MPSSMVLPEPSALFISPIARDPHQESADYVAPRHRLHQLSKKPLAFWFLNQWLEEAELSRQLIELKEKGFGGCFMHPRGGLEVPYGSRRWYDIIAYCVREAKRLGLEPWLYDEDPYPSGAAGGEVTLENPAFKAMELQPHRLDVAEVGEVCFDLPAGMLHAVYLCDEDGVHPIDGEAGLVRTEWAQGMRFNSYYPPYGNQGSPHWRGETHSPHFRVVTFVRKVPATLLGFVRVPAVQNPWGDFPDLMNADAVDAFIRLTYLRYTQHLGGDIGSVIPGIFTDESKLRGFIPWSPELDRWTQKVGNVGLHEVLPHLALDLQTSTPWYRWVFREALAQAFLARFVDRVRQACDQLGLLWTGHFSPEEDPITQVLCIPGLFRVLGRMDIPGTDLIGSTLGDASRPLLHLSPKIASSVAHLSGKPYTSCEALAVTDWVQDFGFITRAMHWLFALGVNRIVTHGQYYSIDGPRKREAPPSQFYQAAGWEHMPALMGEIERLSQMLSEGEHRAPVLLYYPEETFMALTKDQEGRRRQSPPSTIWVQREKLGDLAHQLLVRGYDFDLIDAESLLTVSYDHERQLRSTGNPNKHYQIIIIPGSHLTPQTWEHLNRLKAAGAQLCFIEQEITLLQRNPILVQGASERPDAFFPWLSARVRPLWQAEGQLIGHLRDTDDGPLLFLCNNASIAFHGSVELIFSGPYEICDPAIGSWEAVEGPLHLDLPAGLGVLIRKARQPKPRLHIALSGWKPLPVIWENWSARPVSENSLLLHQFTLIARPRRADHQWQELMNSARDCTSELPDDEFFHVARTVDLASPTSPKAFADDGGDRYLMAAFDWSGPLGSAGDIRLVCDSDLLPRLSPSDTPRKLFFLNGFPLPPLQRRRTFDPMNQEASLSNLIREGRNTLLWVQQGYGSKPQPLPYDGIRLFGDFHVDFPFAYASLVSLSSRAGDYPCSAPMPPSLFGHAHYSGMIEYTTSVTLPHLPTRIALRFQKVYESMEIFVNGHSAGHLWKAPYLLELSPDLLQTGRNQIALRCATSPANYLQGLQRPAGCFGPIEWCGC